MCWFGNFQESKGKVASEDVFVYKVIHEMYSNVKKEIIGLVSPYRGMNYKIGELYTVNQHLISPKVVRGCNVTHRIDYGLHCYSERCIASVTYFGNLYIDQPDGDYLATYALGTLFKPKLVKCKIPKGTKYYENSRGEIVTEKLEVLYIVEAFPERKHCKDLERL